MISRSPRGEQACRNRSDCSSPGEPDPRTLHLPLLFQSEVLGIAPHPPRLTSPTTAADSSHMPFARLTDLRRFLVLIRWTPDYPLSTFVNLYLCVLSIAVLLCIFAISLSLLDLYKTGIWYVLKYPDLVHSLGSLYSVTGLALLVPRGWFLT